MKKLKLKAWDKSKKEVFMIHGISFDIKTLAPSSIKVKGQSWEPAEKFELLQWTGLTDRTGTDVYEGDIINIYSISYKVIWNETEACFELIDIECGNSLKLNISDVALGTVIENQYEAAV